MTTTGPITIPHVTCPDGQEPTTQCFQVLAAVYEAAVCLYNNFQQNALQAALDAYNAAIENCDSGDTACLEAAAAEYAAAVALATATHQTRMQRLPQAFEDEVHLQCCPKER